MPTVGPNFFFFFFFFTAPATATAAKSLQSCPTPSDPMECSLPGSSIHGIFQARVLQWDAIAFTDKSVETSSTQILLVAVSEGKRRP